MKVNKIFPCTYACALLCPKAEKLECESLYVDMNGGL